MKPIKTHLLLWLLILTSAANAQWEWSNPKPSGYPNNAIVFVDTLNGFVVNYNGDLIRTKDQGASWFVQQNFPTGITIGYKDSTAIIGGAGMIYLSTDGGQSWTKKIPAAGLALFVTVNIVSRDTAFIVSGGPNANITVWETVDRGNNWQQVNAVPNISSFCMTDSKTGYATTPLGVFKTVDGWQTSQALTMPFGALFNYVKFQNKDVGFVFTPSSYKILETGDGGITWTQATIGFKINGLAFADTNRIVAVGETPLIAVSADGGKTWAAPSSTLVYQLTLFAVGFATPSVGFAVGIGGVILKTTDGGQTWSKYVPVYTDVGAVKFATGSSGFMSTGNTIYKTSDAGSNWTQLSLTSSSGTDHFKYIHFFSKDTGVAICDVPVRVYKTYDGGITWQIMNLNSLYNDNILGAYTISNTIYLSTDGAYGYKMLKSPDAGETWMVQNNDGGIAYKNPVFTDEKTGYAVYGYTVYKTTDSAKTWSQLPVIQMQLLRSLSFPDKLTGYVAGDQSYLLKTSDSGHTWKQLHVDSTNGNVPGDLKHVKFYNYKIGFVVSGTSVYRTVTGGQSWKLLESSAGSLNGIEIAPDTSLYVYGINGQVLKRNIRTWETDLFKADSIRSCNAKLSARVTTVLTTVDSVWIQYGTSSYQDEVTVIPSSIVDTSLVISATIPNLNETTMYKARLKLYCDGNYYYTDSITFTTVSLPAPSISLSNGSLISSISQNNQWYRDGVALPGANQPAYTPVEAGTYTVQTIDNGCSSTMSASFVFVVTAIPDPIATGEIRIFPNPVRDNLAIQNSRLNRLLVEVFNSLGNKIFSFKTLNKESVVDMRSCTQGVYLVRITELKSGRQFSKTIIKIQH